MEISYTKGKLKIFIFLFVHQSCYLFQYSLTCHLVNTAVTRCSFANTLVLFNFFMNTMIHWKCLTNVNLSKTKTTSYFMTNFSLSLVCHFLMRQRNWQTNIQNLSFLEPFLDTFLSNQLHLYRYSCHKFIT